MTDPTPPAKKKRGGRRPGAGAPRGNLNAIKHGLSSDRITRGMMLLALYPEAIEALRALKRADQRTYRDRFFHTILTASHLATADPALAQSIRNLIQTRFDYYLNHPGQIPAHQNQKIEQSNNQTLRPQPKARSHPPPEA